jgi:hypothetical protein
MRGVLAVAITIGCGGGASKPADAPAVDAPTADARIDAAPGTFTLTTMIDGAATNLPFVAGHDGVGAWQAMSGTAGVYTLASASGRYGVAWVCPSSTNVNVIEATPGELAAYTAYCGSPGPTVSGVVSNIPSLHSAIVDITGDSYSAQLGISTGASGLAYSGQAEPGHNDLVLTLKMNGSIDTTGVALARDVIVPVGGLTQNFDASTAFTAFASHTLTVQGASASETVTGRSGMVTARGTYVVFDHAATSSFRAMPTAQLQAGEVDYAAAVASDASAGTARSVHGFFRAPANTTLSFPPAANAVVTAAATTPIVQLRADLGIATVQMYTFSYSQSGGPWWLSYVSSGWMAASAASDYTTPDLSAVAGWSASYALAAGTATGYFVDFNASSAGLAGLLLPPGDGAVTSLFELSGQITP